MELTAEEIQIIIRSLDYSKQKITNTPIGKAGYPSYEFKQAQLKEISQVLTKLRNIRDGVK